jgi:hypothetical protein
MACHICCRRSCSIWRWCCWWKLLSSGWWIWRCWWNLPARCICWRPHICSICRASGLRWTTYHRAHRASIDWSARHNCPSRTLILLLPHPPSIYHPSLNKSIYIQGIQCGYYHLFVDLFSRFAKPEFHNTHRRSCVDPNMFLQNCDALCRSRTIDLVLEPPSEFSSTSWSLVWQSVARTILQDKVQVAAVQTAWETQLRREPKICKIS